MRALSMEESESLMLVGKTISSSRQPHCRAENTGMAHCLNVRVNTLSG
ncbi:hypothetical protein WG66_012764 [Moniliophthora roreri]|nr:hypothetical protein WG66_012764 [Moniliophthora roreri]